MPMLKVATLKNKWRTLLVNKKRLSEPVPLGELDTDIVTSFCVDALQRVLALYGTAMLPSVRLGVCALIAGDRAQLRATLVAPVLRQLSTRRTELLAVRRVGVARRRIADMLAIDDNIDSLPPDLVVAAHVDVSELHGKPIRHTPEALALSTLRCELQHSMVHDILYNAGYVQVVLDLISRSLERYGNIANVDGDDAIDNVALDSDSSDASTTLPSELDEQLSLLCEPDEYAVDDSAPLQISASAALARPNAHNDCEHRLALCDLLHAPIDNERGLVASLTMHPLAVVTRLAVQFVFGAIQRAAVQVRSGLVCSEEEWLQGARLLDLRDSSLLERTKFAHLSKQSVYHIAGVAVRKALKSTMTMPLRACESFDDRTYAATHMAAHLEADENGRHTYRYAKKTRAVNKVRTGFFLRDVV